eukprot:TRINITY_DN712_c0_g2_i1.p1 TRINITY_DN712_c0_g2~~TRINITY_DN712_c0_g2_i1.p1  ORF type:complete len:304 (+),score=69.72 TRINITY_DN712_c0_g2_i1:84-995(+)
MIRRPPRSTLSSSSAASDVYKRQVSTQSTGIRQTMAESPTTDYSHEDLTYYDMDTDQLVRPSDLLIGDHAGHNFKHIESDFTALQQRVMQKVLIANKKKGKVAATSDSLAHLGEASRQIAAQGQLLITETMQALREELTRVEEDMRSTLARAVAANDAAIEPSVSLCDSILCDLEEGVVLAKSYLASEDPDSKPLSVVQSIEVGINEIVETNVRTDIKLKKASPIDCGAVVARMNAMKLRFEDVATEGVSDILKKPAPAFERLHALSVRRRVEDVNLPDPAGTPFSSFPASPPHTGGMGQSHR